MLSILRLRNSQGTWNAFIVMIRTPWQYMGSRYVRVSQRKTRHIETYTYAIRYRTTATLWRPQIKQYTASNEGRGSYIVGTKQQINNNELMIAKFYFSDILSSQHSDKLMNTTSILRLYSISDYVEGSVIWANFILIILLYMSPLLYNVINNMFMSDM